MSLQRAFNYNGIQFRTVNRNGEPWFVLKDVCDVLELSNARMVRDRLSDDVSSTYPIPDSLGRMQDTTIINEDGLYDVILESRKTEAKAFRKWITSDVIPSIRKHGAYMTPETIEKTLSDPDFIINLATQLKTERTARLQAEAKIEADRPKVLFAESLEISKDAVLIADMARMLRQIGFNIGEIRLYQYLRDNGYLIKSGSDRNMPTQRSMDLGLFEIKRGTRMGSNGESKITRTPKVTGKGQQYFINHFKKRGESA